MPEVSIAADDLLRLLVPQGAPVRTVERPRHEHDLCSMLTSWAQRRGAGVVLRSFGSPDDPAVQLAHRHLSKLGWTVHDVGPGAGSVSSILTHLGRQGWSMAPYVIGSSSTATADAAALAASRGTVVTLLVAEPTIALARRDALRVHGIEVVSLSDVVADERRSRGRDFRAVECRCRDLPDAAPLLRWIEVAKALVDVSSPLPTGWPDPGFDVALTNELTEQLAGRTGPPSPLSVARRIADELPGVVATLQAMSWGPLADDSVIRTALVRTALLVPEARRALRRAEAAGVDPSTDIPPVLDQSWQVAKVVARS